MQLTELYKNPSRLEGKLKQDPKEEVEIKEPFSSFKKDEPKSKIKGESATKNSTNMNSYFKNKNHILCFQCRERQYYKNKYPFY